MVLVDTEVGLNARQFLAVIVSGNLIRAIDYVIKYSKIYIKRI